MDEMNKILLSLLLIAACGKDGGPAVKAAEDMADEVCACPDTACAFKAAARFEPVMAGFSKDGVDVSGEKGKRIVAAGERMARCMAEAGK
jgi:hypothetical protein